ncbi:MAG: nuclear transport factor 2 family protein [Cellvibrio sp.]
MILANQEMLAHIKIWLQAWDNHNLDGVMDLMHEDVVFENWTGQIITGKKSLQRAWAPWFLKHGNFKFITEDIFADELTQKALFQWRLEWPSIEMSHKGQLEVRRGVDVLHFLDGKIREKYSYSKTTLKIDDQLISLEPVNK